MKVVLALCPVWHIKTPPLGLAYLTAYLKKHGHEVINFDFNIDLYNRVSPENKVWWNFEIPEEQRRSRLNEEFFTKNKFLNKEINKWVKKILKTNSKVVCLSSYAESREFSIGLANRIKREDSSIKIILGGPLCHKKVSDSRWFKHEKSIDYIVIGEGEKTLLQLVNSIERGKEIKYCSGALVKHNNRIISGKNRKPIIHLDSCIPFPDFSGFQTRNYTKPYEILISGSRGCPGHCAFCKDRLSCSPYRTRSAKSIFEEMKTRLNQGYNSFEFCDLLLNGHIPTLERLCDLIIKHKPPIKWGGPIRSNPKMNLRIFKKMKKAGIDCINLGIESGSQKMLDKMEKGYKTEVVEKNLKDMHKAGIIASINLLVGFPGETEETVNQTIRFIKRNHKYIKRVSSLTPLYIIPGTDIYKNYKNYKIKKQRDMNLWKSEEGANNSSWRIEQCTIIYQLIQNLNIKHECNQYKKEMNTASITNK